MKRKESEKGRADEQSHTMKNRAEGKSMNREEEHMLKKESTEGRRSCAVNHLTNNIYSNRIIILNRKRDHYHDHILQHSRKVSVLRITIMKIN
jgi:hypothetical protein